MLRDSNSGKILLVEDNDDDVTLMKRAFKKSQMPNEMIIARNGVAALDLLFGMNGKERVVPTFVILDLKLPKLNGLDVLRAIRANEFTKSMPVIVLTTSSEQEDIIHSYDLGANSYIRKPVEFDRFLEVISSLNHYWITLNEHNPKYNG